MVIYFQAAIPDAHCTQRYMAWPDDFLFFETTPLLTTGYQ